MSESEKEEAQFKVVSLHIKCPHENDFMGQAFDLQFRLHSAGAVISNSSYTVLGIPVPHIRILTFES